MPKQSLKFVQLFVVLALFLSNVVPAIAALPLRVAAIAETPASPDNPDATRPNQLVQLPTEQSRRGSHSSEGLASASSLAAGWTTLITDSFESFPADWSLYSAVALDQTWGATTVNADVEYNPASLNSVWPAAAGVDAVDPISGTYPNDLESWMIRGPLDLTTWKAAELDFSANYDIEEGDWLGVCVSAFISEPAPADFDQDNDCSWLYGTTDGWEFDYLDITDYVGYSDVYIAFVFQSDSSNAEAYAGPFIDEVELWVNDTEVDPTDLEDEFVNWFELDSESFDNVALDSDPLWKLETAVGGSAWVTTTVINDEDSNPNSTASASPTVSFTYGTGEASWMFYGPVDLSEQVEADVFYSAYYDLIYSDDDNADNDDWLAFCAFTSAEALANVSADDVNYDNCDWWSGYSGESWEQGFFDLTPFAGNSQVYLAWYFESNNDNAAGGVYVDELFIEGQHADAVVPPAVTFDAAGLELTNGDFANGLTNWQKQTPSGKSGDVVVVDEVAEVTGNQLLLHDFTIVSDTVDVNVYFSYAISTTESLASNDSFCVSLTPTGDPSTILADIGCWDASHVPEFARDGTTYDSYGYNIPHEVIETLQGQAVSLIFEVSQNDSQPTALFVDDVVVYSLGEASRTPGNAVSTSAISAVAEPRDINEPNDSYATATALACNESKAGVFGDVMATANKDQDVFRLDRVPVGKLIINTDAATLQPSSSADTYVFLTDANGATLLDADDDGKTLDTLLVYTNTVANATFYIVLGNYNQDGAGAFYTVKAECGQTSAPPAVSQTVVPPSSTSGSLKPWTMILYLNGEDQACVTAQDPTRCWDKATYEKVVQEMEKFMGAKQSIMNVVVLIDGPNYGGVANDVTRYVVQPNGAYTLGVNKWALPELNMGNPQTLVDFSNWAMANYPAQHYYLAVDDHGGGISGTSWDHHDVGGKAIDDAITPGEMRSAIAQITRNGERKIDIFAFESCLMGLFENLYDLKDYATYITAFQSISWTALQYPEYFKNLLASDTVEQVAKRIIQTYPVTSVQTPYTFGLIQTDKLDLVKTRLDAFATALMGANLAQITTIRNATQAFAGEPGKGDAASDTYGELDLWDFAQRVKAAGIATNEATALQAAIDAAVIEKKAVLKGRTPVWDYSNYHGLSITYPNGAYGALDTYCQVYKLSDHGRGKWSKFLTDKVFGDYSWECGGGTVTSAVNGVQATGLRPQNLPDFLEPKPLADVYSMYMPVTGK